MSDNYQQTTTHYSTEQATPKKRKAAGLAGIVLGAAALLNSGGCATQSQREHAFDRDEPTYGLKAWSPWHREPVWNSKDVSSGASVFSWYGEANRPTLIDADGDAYATMFRPTNYLMWGPRFFTRGVEYLLWDCIAPINTEEDNVAEIVGKGILNFFGAIFGFADRTLYAVGDNTLGSCTVRGLTPGAYELEHTDSEGNKHPGMEFLHRTYDLGKSAAILGGLGRIPS